MKFQAETLSTIRQRFDEWSGKKVLCHRTHHCGIVQLGNGPVLFSFLFIPFILHRDASFFILISIYKLIQFSKQHLSHFQCEWTDDWFVLVHCKILRYFCIYIYTYLNSILSSEHFSLFGLPSPTPMLLLCNDQCWQKWTRKCSDFPQISSISYNCWHNIFFSFSYHCCIFSFNIYRNWFYLCVSVMSLICSFTLQFNSRNSVKARKIHFNLLNTQEMAKEMPYVCVCVCNVVELNGNGIHKNGKPECFIRQFALNN